MIVYELLVFFFNFFFEFFFFCIFNYTTWEYCIFLFLIIIRLLRTLFSLENVVIDFFLLDGVRLNLTILTC